MDLQLKHKTVLVTGANRGTGEVIAETLAAEGANVIVHANEPGGADAVAERIGGTAVAGDIRSDEGAKKVVAATLAAAPDLSILINNYGTGSVGSWASVGEKEFIAMYQTNVLSASRMVQGLVQTIKAQGWGRIVQLGTIGSHQPNSTMPHYYASKGALATLMVGLANELAGTGITVNTVSPGLIHTEEVEQSFRKMAFKKGWGEDWNDIVAQFVASEYPNPSGRIASRQEVADLVVYLASPKADFINGQNIRIDGGAVRYV